MRVIVFALALTILAFALSVAGDLAGAPRQHISERTRIPPQAAEAGSPGDEAQRDSALE